MSVLLISSCAHVISIHAFFHESSCLCLSDIFTTSSGMPVHNTEASDESSFRSFLTGYGPRTRGQPHSQVQRHKFLIV